MKNSCLELLVFKHQNRVCFFCSVAFARGYALQQIIYVVAGYWAKEQPEWEALCQLQGRGWVSEAGP